MNEPAVYVLIVFQFLNGNGILSKVDQKSVQFQEFNSKESCQRAKEIISGLQIKCICVEK